MCVGHVYIVLEPIGSACLKFSDDRYYEFLCFDVVKVVRGPGYDQGHDEESRNGRDIKIDILDDYVRTPERFWKVSDIYRSVGRASPGPKPNWFRARGDGPLFPSPPLPFLPPLLLLLGKGGVLLLVGVGLPLLARLSLAGRLLPLLFYIRGQGHPIDTAIGH